MNFRKTILGATLLAAGLAAHAVTPAARPALPPAAAASAASMPAPPPPGARRSAADKATDAVLPGEVRPQNPVVPQVAVTLPGSTHEAVPSIRANPGAKVPAGTVNERAARCRAIENAAERARCLGAAPVAAATPAK